MKTIATVAHAVTKNEDLPRWLAEAELLGSKIRFIGLSLRALGHWD